MGKGPTRRQNRRSTTALSEQARAARGIAREQQMQAHTGPLNRARTEPDRKKWIRSRDRHQWKQNRWTD